MTPNIVRYVAIQPESRSTPLPPPNESDCVEYVVHHADGESERMRPEVAEAVTTMLNCLNAGGRVVLLEEDQDLTPSEASAILGIPLPLVVQRMNVGDLPFFNVGNQLRCRLKDVLSLREKISAQQRAMDDLSEINEELINKHGLL